jgi:hypothetical protein
MEVSLNLSSGGAVGLNRMVLLSIKEDAVMKNFWESVILKDIERIVKAA